VEQDAMRVRRAGFIVPSSNVVVEPEAARIAALLDDVVPHFTRLAVTEIRRSARADAQFDDAALLGAAQLLRDAHVDVAAWAGTSGSWLGVARERGLVDRVGQRTGIPMTTSTLALIGACQIFGARRVAVVSPYTDDVVADIVASFAGEGLEVVGEAHLGLTDNHEFSEVGPDQIWSLAEAAMHADAEALLVVCTNLRAASLVTSWESTFDVPCFDSLGATIWQVSRLLGVDVSVAGEGALWLQGRARARLHSICVRTLEALGCDRVTVRVDDAQLGFAVDRAAGEAVQPGARRIARDAGINQRSLATIHWLDEHRSLLVQERFDADPRPPRALIEVYSVAAQILGPIERDGALAGWVSAHSFSERRWSASDRKAVAMACEAAHDAFE
jgi:maleate isomerase